MNKTSKITDRIYFLDSARTFLIFLVILLHAGIVYEFSNASGYWWIVDDPDVNDLSGSINIILDIFIMPAIFFISGFFTRRSLTNRKIYNFIFTKVKRLLVPWVIAVLTLMPLYKFIFLYSRNLPQEHWTTYFHWSNGIFSMSWLWFLPVLFLFNILYIPVSRLFTEKLTISFKKTICAVFIIGLIYSVLMNAFHFDGWTKNPVLNFQNERIFLYFLFFLSGSLADKQKIFDSPVKNKKLYFTVTGLACLPLAGYLVLFIHPYLNPGIFIFSVTIDKLLLQLFFQINLFILVYLLLQTFRLYAHKQIKIWEKTNGNSYGVYIIHTIILGGIAMLLLPVPLPSFAKYLVLAITTFIVSNMLVYGGKKIIKIIKFNVKNMDNKK